MRAYTTKEKAKMTDGALAALVIGHYGMACGVVAMASLSAR